MNIYEKIQTVKQKLLEANIKKSGYNKFSNYNYYELSDFLPTIIKLCNEIKLFTQVTFNEQDAKLIIVDYEQESNNYIEYTSPMKELELKGCNQIQALGGVETYQRRYLYMSAFDIVENDMFDGINGKDQKDKENKELDNLSKSEYQVTESNLVTETEAKSIYSLMTRKGLNVVEELKKNYGIDNTNKLTKEQYISVLKVCNGLPDKQ